ncbi:MAG: F0F1 ATP synthase subunit delta [Firmicutes bacterium]|nr:F0F1 ATP synthase subunit delta [Bacillota bacterium]
MNFELIVYTAVALEPQQQQRLQLELQEKYQTEGVIFLVDPSLIGGMKLVFRDRIEDYSLQAKLRAMKKHLTSEE